MALTITTVYPSDRPTAEEYMTSEFRPNRRSPAVHHGNRITVYEPMLEGIDVFLRKNPDGSIRLECEKHHNDHCYHAQVARGHLNDPDAFNLPE